MNDQEIPEFNAGFKIIESKRVLIVDGTIPETPHSIVLAYSENDSKYVTWLFNHRDGGFHWGHYFTNYSNAKKDFINRD